MRARGCTRVLNITHEFAGVCQWKKLGQAHLSWAHVSKENYHFYALYIDE